MSFRTSRLAPLIAIVLAAQIAPATASADPPPRPAGNGAAYHLPAAPPTTSKPPRPPRPGARAKPSLPTATGYLPATGRDAVAGRYIVKLKRTATLRRSGARAVAGALAGEFGGRNTNVLEGVFTGFAASMTEARARRLAADPAVEFVEQEKIIRGADEVTQRTPPSWGLDRVDQRHLPLSTNFTYESGAQPVGGARLFVLDSGIARLHPEFMDANGQSRVTLGINTAGGPDTDCHGHGTHVAGIAAGKTTGVARTASVIDVKVLDCTNVGSVEGIIEGVNWVTGYGRPGDVANMSIGGSRVSNSIDHALAGAVGAGIAFVVAAGNDDKDACNFSPARSPGAITVGSTRNDDHRWADSNYGKCVDLFAPGDNIASADHRQLNPPGYVVMSGTSMAAPHVAGAALLLELPAGVQRTPKAIYERLIENATTGVISDRGPESPDRLLYIGRQTRRPSCNLDSATNVSSAPYPALTGKFRDYASSNDGWTGGDSTYSISGVSGRGRLWIFSDTFLPPVNGDGTRPTSAPLINNSVVEEVSGGLRTHHAGTKSAPAAIMPPPSSTTWYWAGAPHKYSTGNQTRLQIIFHRYLKFGPALWDFRWDKTVLATFGADLTRPEKVQDLPSRTRVTWGSAVHSRNGYTYIYGVEDEHIGKPGEPTSVNKYLHIARVHGDDLGTQAWQYLDAQGDWMAEESRSGRVHYPGNTQHIPVSNEFSIHADGGNNYMITQDTTLAFSGKIMLYKACSPSGPWGGRTELHLTTEGGPWGDYGNEKLYTYNAKGHDGIIAHGPGTQKNLIISYNINSLEPSDVYRNTLWYQPRFLKVTFK